MMGGFEKPFMFRLVVFYFFFLFIFHRFSSPQHFFFFLPLRLCLRLLFLLFLRLIKLAPEPDVNFDGECLDQLKCDANRRQPEEAQNQPLPIALFGDNPYKVHVREFELAEQHHEPKPECRCYIIGVEGKLLVFQPINLFSFYLKTLLFRFFLGHLLVSLSCLVHQAVFAIKHLAAPQLHAQHCESHQSHQQKSDHFLGSDGEPHNAIHHELNRGQVLELFDQAHKPEKTQQVCVRRQVEVRHAAIA
mmetsp:Transcript_152068/g.265071  ORF Transcript_152068/g.265071 Transcript_152068/m.265071 type:complete len:247 (+) Transcript_152068:315-1055(+)